MKILVTGGSGFIGSALIRFLIRETDHEVLNVDKLTYAADNSTLESVKTNSRYHFFQGDICDTQAMNDLLAWFAPNVIMNLAAETHVDRSIHRPADFIQTNIVGTYSLLTAAYSFWTKLSEDKKTEFRFHHISTDEVYGDLGFNEDKFLETTPYNPSSPYSAAKASSDHLVRAWQRTYQLPTLITNCSNNYGPFQFPEKLIPLVISNALQGRALPVYGDGKQIRDWLYVDDHARALYQVICNGKVGETYNIGGNNEKTNLEVVTTICDILQNIEPCSHTKYSHYKELIQFVTDRPGHDVRYAIDAGKIQRELNWFPEETFETGIEKTVRWYIENNHWCRDKNKVTSIQHKKLPITEKAS